MAKLVRKYHMIPYDEGGSIESGKRFLEKILNDPSLDVVAKCRFYQDLLYKIRQHMNLPIVNEDMFNIIRENFALHMPTTNRSSPIPSPAPLSPIPSPAPLSPAQLQPAMNVLPPPPPVMIAPPQLLPTPSIPTPPEPMEVQQIEDKKGAPVKKTKSEKKKEKKKEKKNKEKKNKTPKLEPKLEPKVEPKLEPMEVEDMKPPKTKGAPVKRIVKGESTKETKKREMKEDKWAVKKERASKDVKREVKEEIKKEIKTEPIKHEIKNEVKDGIKKKVKKELIKPENIKKEVFEQKPVKKELIKLENIKKEVFDDGVAIKNIKKEAVERQNLKRKKPVIENLPSQNRPKHHTSGAYRIATKRSGEPSIFDDVTRKNINYGVVKKPQSTEKSRRKTGGSGIASPGSRIYCRLWKF
ncbi:hypothetical protein GCK72_012332 [Caenorhabditis remanei]|uniref:Uncharacterized protein n=1 Tax=Caenorhabditis remanei TaxID=31234 RepID=A0A6A5GND0_CAERE|nr:hypothetical protein GCK72_012332 [Caenorhabditis remanei]KAF1755879.1 hypothetical protein GCK72_012332 [Caenorhabditis remanei]